MKKLFRKLFPSKEMRAYRKMHRRHRRELVKLAKTIREWDYGWIDELVLTQIRHMHEYFATGNNVHQTDDTRSSIVEQLKHVLDLYEELDNIWVADAKSYSMEEIKNRYIKEQELYEEIYSYIAKNLQYWWD